MNGKYLQGEIEINEQFRKALDLLENSKNHVFITGKAGTGKSTLLIYFRSITKKRIVVLAPTGVAAVNIGGETIHSFFGFKSDVTIEKIRKEYEKNKKRNDSFKIYKILDAIIIDEVSMVRADLLDCVDYFLRLYRASEKPFGNTQMIFFGDLYQLPPVVKSKELHIFKSYYETPYFFSAKVFKDPNFSMEFIELEKIYRQTDETFIKLLNKIRNNTIYEEDLQILNKRVILPDEIIDSNNKTKAKAKSQKADKKDFFVYLTTVNKLASEINERKLKELNEKIYTYKAHIIGNFDKDAYPAEIELKIAKGAQVMLLNNDPDKRWINGTIGEVNKIVYDKEKEVDIIYVKLSNGEIVEVLPYEWEIFHFYYDKQKNAIETKTVGEFIQYPLKLAWAITIHKSQGLTFDKVILDLRRGAFAPGQIYVALSRCRTLNGIYLTRPLRKKDIFMDKRIVKFVTNFQYKLSEKKLSKEQKLAIVKKAISEKFFLEITYLKTNDEKSHRIIQPYSVGEFEYAGKKFEGIRAFCFERKEERVFRLDRILEIKIVGVSKLPSFEV